MLAIATLTRTTQAAMVTSTPGGTSGIIVLGKGAVISRSIPHPSEGTPSNMECYPGRQRILHQRLQKSNTTMNTHEVEKNWSSTDGYFFGTGCSVPLLPGTAWLFLAFFFLLLFASFWMVLAAPPPGAGVR